MILIAHRGNMTGPNAARENAPDYLQHALDVGFDVELDVWLRGGELFLGHDGPRYLVPVEFLRNQRVWTHAKDKVTYDYLKRYQDINMFYIPQGVGSTVNTTHKYLWHNGPLTEQGNLVSIVKEGVAEPFARYSDYVASLTKDWTKRTTPFDLLVIDIDGVMTNGTKLYDREGRVMAKSYCDLDFTAIKRFKAAGIKVCFLSGDRTVNEAMAKTRKIDFWHNQPGVDKVTMLPQLCEAYTTRPERIAYVGDDYYDTAMMQSVGLSFCPSTSPVPVQRAMVLPATLNPLDVAAGQGVIAKLYDAVAKDIAYVFPVDSKDVNPC